MYPLLVVCMILAIVAVAVWEIEKSVKRCKIARQYLYTLAQELDDKGDVASAAECRRIANFIDQGPPSVMLPHLGAVV